MRARTGPFGYVSRMNPWRAALTSATASGKSTRIASRSAIGLLVAPPPCGWICCSAAAVSSTAVLSVSVANCSRCASWTRLGLLLGELAQSAHDLLGVAPERESEASAFHAASLAAHHRQLADQPEDTDVDARRRRDDVPLAPWSDFSPMQQKAGELDLDVLRARRASCRRSAARRSRSPPRRRARPDAGRAGSRRSPSRQSCGGRFASAPRASARRSRRPTSAPGFRRDEGAAGAGRSSVSRARSACDCAR